MEAILSTLCMTYLQIRLECFLFEETTGLECRGLCCEKYFSQKLDLHYAMLLRSSKSEKENHPLLDSAGEGTSYQG